MRSNYKKLGPYIREVSEKNTDLDVVLLLGVSVSKKFIPSIANTIGTDMSRYKIVHQNQFAYGPVTSRNSDKISVALLSEPECIVSTSYTVFEIIELNDLMPEYLMMWFRRPEFDRYARFMSHGSVRELFGWDEMCNVELPIPSIEKQREVVKEYQTLGERIRLNERLNEKLEEAAQAIYKQWFVDFEFPMTEEQAKSIGKPECVGQPYQSSGGEMENSDILQVEVPKAWVQCQIQDLINQGLIEPNQDGNHGEIHPKTSDFVSEGVPFVVAANIRDGRLDLRNCKKIPRSVAEKLRIGFAREGDVLLTHKATMGEVCVVPPIEDYIVLTPQVTYFRVKENSKLSREFLYGLFTSEYFQRILVDDSGQSTRSYLSITNQRKIEILIPPIHLIQAYTRLVRPLLEAKQHSKTSSDALNELREILASRMTRAA